MLGPRSPPVLCPADVEENARRQAASKKAVVLSPIAIEVVRRIDALFDIERPINGKPAEERKAVRQELSKPLVEALQIYMREQRVKLSRSHDLAKAIDYILKRWVAFTPDPQVTSPRSRPHAYSSSVTVACGGSRGDDAAWHNPAGRGAAGGRRWPCVLGMPRCLPAVP